jgi:hypothetical protein
MGTAALLLRLGPDGAPQHAHVFSISFQDPMLDCLVDAGFAARFSPPRGGGATLIVPITFMTR